MRKPCSRAGSSLGSWREAHDLRLLRGADARDPGIQPVMHRPERAGAAVKAGHAGFQQQAGPDEF
jgi:hypothetical protein